jgi:hypothetical protein
MTEKPDAVAYFRGQQGYNCAQAILKVFAHLGGFDESCLDRFARVGGGRAPGGECGALFAAKAILRDSVAKQEVEKAFVATAGSSKCRDIRRGRSLSCEQCVQTAAEAVFVQLKLRGPLQRPVEGDSNPR